MYIESALKALFFIIQIMLLFFWGYWFAISLFGFGYARKTKRHPKIKKFLMLVAAHNEENVIGNLVDNLHQLDYPKELYDIYVIADNCTDRTAVITREKGGKVIEHASRPDEPKGKPYAIKYAFEVLDKELDNYDAFCVFDADNLVSSNYLSEMNNLLSEGHKLIQCYLDTKNPNDNWISLAYASSYYYMNRSWQLAKSRLGLGNAIGGTGFCVEMTVLREVGWNATSLTEDLEFQIQCLLKGIKAGWSHHAKIYDEKPIGVKVSCVQRLRWARGHWDVCFRYAGALLKKAIFKHDFLAFDGLMYLINPGKIVIGALTTVVIYIQLFFKGESWFHRIMPVWMWISLFFFQLFYISYAMVKDSKNSLSTSIKAIFYLPLFNWIYIPLFVWALFTKKNKTWIRTEHTRSIEFTDSHHNVSA